MEKIEKMVANCMQDQDIDKEYIINMFWSMISADGEVDSLEREYYEKLCCFLKQNKSRFN